jgi:teichuronic acid exporter
MEPLNRMMDGLRISFIAKYLNIGITIILGAILARLLTPEIFGQLAMLMVFLGFFNQISNLGLRHGIIQNKDLDRQDIGGIFMFSIFISMLLAIIFMGLCPVIAKFYHLTILAKIGPYAAVIIILNSMVTILGSILIRDLRFKDVGIIETIANLISGVVAIILVYGKLGIYALIYKDIILNIILLVMYWCFTGGYPFGFALRFHSISKIFHYSIHQSGAEAYIYISRNLDNLLVGRFLGDSALGFYDRAYKLMQYPVSNLANIISPVFHSVLSNYQQNKTIILKTYERAIEVTGAVAFPLTALLFFSGKEIILLIYGQQWHNSIAIFKVFSLTCGFQILREVAGPIFRAINKTDLLLKVVIAHSILVITGIIIGLSYGLFGVSCGFSIGAFIGSGIFMYSLNKELGNSTRIMLQRLGRFSLISILLGLVLHLINMLNIQSMILALFIKFLITLLWWWFFLRKSVFRLS